MKKIYLLIIMLFLPFFLHAQFLQDGDLLSHYGHVGINTVSPTSPLHVYEPLGGTTIMVDAASDANANLIFGIEGQHAANIRVNDSGNDQLQFQIINDSGTGWLTALSIDKSANVGIDVPNPAAKLDIHEPTSLGSIAGDNILLRRISGKTAGNRYMNNLWLRRESDGPDWLSARLHDGISIDVSFLTPGEDTRTWWERDPYRNIQSWGHRDESYLTINKGSVGIGTTAPDSKLTVVGNINAQEITVSATAGGADFVFEEDYDLPSLKEIDKYIKANKHLPGIPSAETMEKEGLYLAEMNIKLLQKIEELTLYMIQQEKGIEELFRQKEQVDKLIQQNKVLNDKLKATNQLIADLIRRVEMLEK